jgi:hypothetical protein
LLLLNDIALRWHGADVSGWCSSAMASHQSKSNNDQPFFAAQATFSIQHSFELMQHCCLEWGRQPNSHGACEKSQKYACMKQPTVV